jgi:hypothetical protein
MKIVCKTNSGLLFLFVLFSGKGIAQFSISAQLRTRTEFRNGQGTPLAPGVKPAFFTSQRTRLSAFYNIPRVRLGLSIQDVRVWGQDVSTINKVTAPDLNTLMLHEGWADILLSDTSNKNTTLNLKIGRQELVYDDQRLLGNLDWLQQGRTHDAAVLRFVNNDLNLHLGAAFNQNKENASGTIYNSTPPGNYPANTNGGSMYKSLEYFYAGQKLTKGNLSFLFLADQFNKFSSDSITAAKVYKTDTWGRATTGIYFIDLFNKTGLTASAYYQFGTNSTGQNVSAYLLTGTLQYQLFKKFTASTGVDYYSGGSPGTTSHTFDPLYGTPHKFAGIMDYYYAANPFGKNGLADYYLKGKFILSAKTLLSLDIHQFNSATSITTYSSKNLGQEMDLTTLYNLTAQVSIEGGYAHYFTTALLNSPSVKNIPNAKPNADWAYVMVNVKPEFLFK